MKKIGSIQFFENIDLNLNFTFDDLMNHFRKSAEGVKNEFLNNDKGLKLDLVEKYVEEYVNQKIKQKFGDEFRLDVMDDTMNISWDIKVESIKKHHKEAWWNKEGPDKLKLPKLKKV